MFELLTIFTSSSHLSRLCSVCFFFLDVVPSLLICAQIHGRIARSLFVSRERKRERERSGTNKINYADLLIKKR